MAPRGPDAAGVWVQRHVGLGHRRLSIIDLEERSNQPMSDPTGRYWLVYNGEVYNVAEIRAERVGAGLRFLTQSDTEVVLQALIRWGPDALAKFNGMFALALWDDHEQQLLLARDRLGVKPLYVDVADPRTVRFASTLSPILALCDQPRDLDLPALAAYLKMLYIPAPHTAVAGIRKVPAGGLMQWNARTGWREAFWWEPATFAGDTPPKSFEDALDQLDTRIRQAVRYRMISDVPLGVFLSGGIDSSLITAHMAAISSTPVKTFTIGSRHQEHDESEVARSVARHLGTDHHELVAEPQDLLSLVEEFPQIYDEPFADASAIPTLMVSKLTRQHVTVALCGDGGDELFGGYRYYSIGRMYAAMLHAPQRLRSTVARSADWLPPAAAMAMTALAQPDLLSVFGYMRSASKGADWAQVAKVAAHSYAHVYGRHAAWRQQADVRLRLMAVDVGSYLPDDILVKGDRASMAASLEARHPLLDRDVVRYAFSLPAAWMFHRGQTKWILRQLLSRYVPRSISERPKHGFTVPIRTWFRQELRAPLQDRLSSAALRDDPLLHPKAVADLIREHSEGTRHHEHALWAMLIYRQWLDHARQRGWIRVP